MLIIGVENEIFNLLFDFKIWNVCEGILNKPFQVEEIKIWNVVKSENILYRKANSVILTGYRNMNKNRVESLQL